MKEMTGKSILFFILLFVIGFAMKTQGQCGNLVPNPSFEDYNACPDYENQFFKVNDWWEIASTVDYFNACDTTNATGIPNNYWGYQRVATGNAYAGLITLFGITGNQQTSDREYFGCQLLSPLVPQTKYYVSLKVSPTANNNNFLGSNKFVSNNLGVLFTNNHYSSGPTGNPLPIPNFAHVYTDTIISDTTKWTTISGFFIADSAYQYLTIGNFFDNNSTSYLVFNPSGMWPIAYYYIDDVCVSSDSLICASSTPFCSDNNACTTDTFINGQYLFIPIACSDSNACTADICDSLTGCHFVSVLCDDSNICTADSCSDSIGCFYSLIHCDDNNICTKDVCDTLNACFHTSVTCDDFSVCTVDTCDSVVGCIHSLIDCSDHDSCTIDACDSLSGCFYNPVINCPDGITSTPQASFPLVYPNPTAGLVTIEFPVLHWNGRVYNHLGQSIISLNEINEKQFTTLDLSSQPNGIYLLTVETAKFHFSYKIFLNP